MPEVSWQNFSLSDDGSRQNRGFEAFLSNNSSQPAREEEGELLVDVAQTEKEVIIVATMAGTPPDKIELHLHNDLLTIRGERQSPVPKEADFFHKENFWGKFSRSIVLPVDVKHELSKADYKNGILIVHLLKEIANKSIPIVIIEE